MFNSFQLKFLRRFYPLNPVRLAELPPRQDLKDIFGAEFIDGVKDKIVFDFGCGHGSDTEDLARWGAKEAIGIEIREDIVLANRERNKLPNCSFHTNILPENVGTGDVVISVDAFEHFDDPKLMLSLMHSCLRPGGEAYVSFGPTWLHPRGGHLFSVFPWAHLLMSEEALMEWRNRYYSDGASKFTEVSGGLNKLKISEFEKLISESSFEIIDLSCLPIRKSPLMQKLLGRERGTSIVQARLRRK